MKNIFDVINQKEAEAQQLQKEIDALRLAARLLSEESEKSVLAAAASGAAPVRQGPASHVASVPSKDAAQGGLRQFP